MHFETPPEDRHASVSTVAMPRDTNALGDIFGGWLMSHADIAGAILGYRRAGGRVVTVAVESFIFIAPVFVGDLVSCYADIVKIGTSSITVKVETWVRRRHDTQRVKVTEGTLVYVAIDSNGRPRPVPKQGVEV